MKISISDNVLKSYNLTIEEFMVLYLNYRDFNLNSTNEELINKGYASKHVLDENKLVVSNEIGEMLTNIIVDSKDEIEPKLDRFDALADKLIVLYPQGKKPGTNYYWRDSRSIISSRLKKIVAKYKVSFTDEQAVNATKKYVESFNGDYRYMQLLKYFIWKNKTSEEGVESSSQLLSYIENEGQSECDNEWGKLV